jgi:outer membrane protein assembly factor BamE (lipoprotein component of BamABCDE complex)
MKKLFVVLALVSLTGCSTIMEYIPSRWDVNQAKSITDIQLQAKYFDCKGDQVAQIDALVKNVEWFNIYSKTKPTRDISKLTGTMTTTIKEYQDRLKNGPVSPLYCDLKKKIIQQQADILAGSVQGRF